MPTPRMPRAKAKALGVDVKNPKRFGQTAAPDGGGTLGEPSEWMGGEQRVIWKMFKSEIPWLVESDRTIMEIACTIRAKMYSGDDVSITAMNQLRLCLSQMGATPADRSKIRMPEGDDDEDPADAYLN